MGHSNPNNSLLELVLMRVDGDQMSGLGGHQIPAIVLLIWGEASKLVSREAPPRDPWLAVQ